MEWKHRWNRPYGRAAHFYGTAKELLKRGVPRNPWPNLHIFATCGWLWLCVHPQTQFMTHTRCFSKLVVASWLERHACATGLQNVTSQQTHGVVCKFLQPIGVPHAIAANCAPKKSELPCLEFGRVPYSWRQKANHPKDEKCNGRRTWP